MWGRQIQTCISLRQKFGIMYQAYHQEVSKHRWQISKHILFIIFYLSAYLTICLYTNPLFLIGFPRKKTYQMPSHSPDHPLFLLIHHASLFHSMTILMCWRGYPLTPIIPTQLLYSCSHFFPSQVTETTHNTVFDHFCHLIIYVFTYTRLQSWWPLKYLASASALSY